MTAPSATKTIRFTDLTEIDYQDGQGKLVYKVDSVHTLRADKADRWVRRGRAVEVTVAEMAELMAAAMPVKPADQTPPPAPVVVPPPAPQAQVAAHPTAVAAPAAPSLFKTEAAKPATTESTGNGNTVAGAADVGGANGGSAGVGPVNVGGRGRGRQGS